MENNRKHFKPECNLNNIYAFSSHLTYSTLIFSFKDLMVNDVRELIIVHSEKHTQRINTPREQTHNL
jgi:hypothetical protein